MLNIDLVVNLIQENKYYEILEEIRRVYITYVIDINILTENSQIFITEINNILSISSKKNKNDNICLETYLKLLEYYNILLFLQRGAVKPNVLEKFNNDGFEMYPLSQHGRYKGDFMTSQHDNKSLISKLPFF